MSKKITGEKDTKRTTIVPLTNNGIKHMLRNVEEKKGPKNLPITNVNHFKNRISKNNIGMKNLQLPQVKPLIININQDSDSEDDLFKTLKNTETQIVQQKQIDIEIEQSVDKFLKEQRAKVEAQLSPIPKYPPKPKNSSLILEKSCVKLLPKVKQVEYQKLLQRLKNAEKKPRIRRLSNKLTSEGKPMASTSKKIVRGKLPVNKQVMSAVKVDPVPTAKSEVRTLHKILKELQVQKNGRLQIQEKYKVLMPVIKKINEASLERRKWEDEVKRLLQEITDMKKQLLKSQQDFNIHVSNLVQEKERIDKSMQAKKSELTEDKKAAARFTSTPIKDIPSAVSFETSSLPVTTSNNTLPLSEKIAELCVGEQKDEDIVDAPLNPGDPNDIDKIYSKQKNTFPKYISPLDNVKRVLDDPFSIVCPYDVDGNCRDPECIYKHFSK